jgi:hypothetical protein
MNLQLCQDALCMVPCSVLANFKFASYGLVGTSFGQELGHLTLAPGKTIAILYRAPSVGFAVGDAGRVLSAEGVSDLAQLVDSSAQLVEKKAIIAT